MAGRHQWLDGRESEWTLGVGDGQGGLACCDSWGCKEPDMTERLNWTELRWKCHQFYCKKVLFQTDLKSILNKTYKICNVLTRVTQVEIISSFSKIDNLKISTASKEKYHILWVLPPHLYTHHDALWVSQLNYSNCWLFFVCILVCLWILLIGLLWFPKAERCLQDKWHHHHDKLNRVYTNWFRGSSKHGFKITVVMQLNVFLMFLE